MGGGGGGGGGVDFCFVSPPPWQLCDTPFECGKFMVCFSIGMNGKTDHTLQTGDLATFLQMPSVMYCVTFSLSLMYSDPFPS